jgi:cation transport ATPase
LLIAIAALGWLNQMLAGAAMALSSLSVIINRPCWVAIA